MADQSAERGTGDTFIQQGFKAACRSAQVVDGANHVYGSPAFSVAQTGGND